MNPARPVQMPLRLPGSLHRTLKEAAGREGISLNQYCLYLLSRHCPPESKEEEIKNRGEDLLRFLEEAAVLQKEFEKTSKRAPSREPPTETPKERYQKLHGKN